MEISLNKKSSIDKQVVALGSFFVFTFLLSCNPHIQFVIGFALPFIVVAFCCGYRYVSVFYLGLFMSCFFYSQNQVVLIIAISVGSLFQLASIIKVATTGYMALLISLTSLFYLYIFNYDLSVIIIAGVFSLFHGTVYKELIPVFMHNAIEVYSESRWTVLLMVIFLCCTSVMYVNEVYMFLMLRYILLLCIFYLGIHVTIPCLLYISVMLIIQDVSMQNEVLGILLPSFMYFIYLPKSKYKFACIYMLSHIFLPFFIQYDYFYHGFIILFSAMLFITTPNILSRKSVLSTSFKEHTLKNKLAQKADTFSSLFKQLTALFQQTASVSSSEEYAKFMYQDVCANCSSKDVCYDGGPNRLVKLIHKGLKEEYTLSDRSYIDSYCVKPDTYVKSMEIFRDSFNAMNNNRYANKNLKEDLFEEFSLLGHVFENFSDSIHAVNEDKEALSDFLKGYYFDMKFIKKYSISNHSYMLELGFMGGSKKIVYEELVPILQTYLNQSLEVVSIQESVPYLGYTAVVLKHDIPFVVDFGMSQISYDPYHCGDSYTSFKHDQSLYYSISDGMGQGKVAGVESKLTLDILSKLVCNGIALEDTLDSINALLRIKNKSDMYTTLDLCKIDLHRSKAQFVKYGAFNSYAIYDNKIDVVENRSLPVGVVSDIKMTLFETSIKIGDVIVLCSDGVGDMFIDILKRDYRYFNQLKSQVIATKLMDKVVQYCKKDDATIIVLKIESVA